MKILTNKEYKRLKTAEKEYAKYRKYVEYISEYFDTHTDDNMKKDVNKILKETILNYKEES